MDIEDAADDARDVGTSAKTEVEVKIRRRVNVKKRQAIDNSGDADVAASEKENAPSSMIPGRASVWIHTWGCAHNNSDSEYMAGLLSRAGYSLTTDASAADVHLLNSCTVKTPSEMQLKNHVERAQREDRRVVVAGCVSQAEPNESWLSGVSIVGVKQIERVVEVLEETLKGNVVRLLSAKRSLQPALALPKIRRNPLVEVLAINSGCLNSCTYCKTKLARGDLHSYGLDDLVERAKSAFSEGVKELWLTSEDLGAWGRDIGLVLPDLLERLVEVIPDDCMMRLGMTNPPYILDYLEEIAAILRHPRVYSFLHIPVQAGSDAVLRDMRREYTADQFRMVVDYMIKHVPDVYVATDFICAFPTETEQDFEESLQLLDQYRFPSVFINQYFPRSGTPAARLKLIDTKEAKRRTQVMSQLFRSYSRYSPERVGEVHRVLVCERATDGQHLVGHNKQYEHMLIAAPSTALGTWMDVRVVDVSKFHMMTEPIASSTSSSCSSSARSHQLSLLLSSGGRSGGRRRLVIPVLVLVAVVLFWHVLLG